MPSSPPEIEEPLVDIEERFKKLVVEHLGIELDQLTPSAKFIEDLGADSLDTVELVMACEEEFNGEVSDEDAEKLLTIGDALAYLRQRLAQEPRLKR